MSKLKDFINGISPTAQVTGAVNNVVEGAKEIIKRRQEGKITLEEAYADLDKLKENNVTERWRIDANSDSMLSKSARPFALYFTMINVFALIWVTVLTKYEIDEVWIPLIITIVSTVLGGYFVLRTIEKKK